MRDLSASFSFRHPVPSLSLSPPAKRRACPSSPSLPTPGIGVPLFYLWLASPLATIAFALSVKYRPVCSTAGFSTSRSQSRQHTAVVWYVCVVVPLRGWSPKGMRFSCGCRVVFYSAQWLLSCGALASSFAPVGMAWHGMVQVVEERLTFCTPRPGRGWFLDSLPRRTTDTHRDVVLAVVTHTAATTALDPPPLSPPSAWPLSPSHDSSATRIHRHPG